MIALRGAIHGGVFSSFMFFSGLLPVPQTRRECVGTRHFFSVRDCGGRECAEKEAENEKVFMCMCGDWIPNDFYR